MDFQGLFLRVYQDFFIGQESYSVTVILEIRLVFWTVKKTSKSQMKVIDNLFVNIICTLTFHHFVIDCFPSY